METQKIAPFEVILPSAYLGSTHASVIIQDGTTLNKPAGYVFELFYEEILQKGEKSYRVIQSPTPAIIYTPHQAVASIPAPTPKPRASRVIKPPKITDEDGNLSVTRIGN